MSQPRPDATRDQRVQCDFLVELANGGSLKGEGFRRHQSREHYAAGTEFQIGRLEMVGNTGTYLDSPFHRYATGADLAGLPLTSLADLPGLVVRVPAGTRAIPRSLVSGQDVCGRAVLFHTGWDAYWGGDAYFAGHPFLTREAALYLVRARAVRGLGTFPVRAFALLET